MLEVDDLGHARYPGTRTFPVLSVESGPDVLELANKQGRQIDLRPSDINTPEMTGPSLVKTLAKLA
jgi:CheY-like chemotaxis protein